MAATGQVLDVEAELSNRSTSSLPGPCHLARNCWAVLGIAIVFLLGVVLFFGSGCAITPTTTAAASVKALPMAFSLPTLLSPFTRHRQRLTTHPHVMLSKSDPPLGMKEIDQSDDYWDRKHWAENEGHGISAFEVGDENNANALPDSSDRPDDRWAAYESNDEYVVSTASTEGNSAVANKRQSVSGLVWRASEFSPRVQLYTKSGCTLCDEAKRVLEQARETVPHTLEQVDITDPENEQWRRMYKYDIPVFHIDGSYWTKHRLTLQEALDSLQDAQQRKMLGSDPFPAREGQPDAEQIESSPQDNGRDCDEEGCDLDLD